MNEDLSSPELIMDAAADYGLTMSHHRPRKGTDSSSAEVAERVVEVKSTTSQLPMLLASAEVAATDDSHKYSCLLVNGQYCE